MPIPRSGVTRRTLLNSLVAPALGLPLRAVAQDGAYSTADMAHARLLRERGLESGLAYSLVESLVTQVGPRAAGSAGDAKAVQWALERFQQLGFDKVRAEPVPLLAWQRGTTAAQLLAPEAHPLVVTALGNTVGTPSEGLEAEVAYYPDFETLKADPGDRARGRIVFIDQKTERTRDGSGYGRAVLARVAGAVEASRRGAVAVAIRSIGTDRDRIAHTGALRYDPLVAAIPAVAVSVPDADLIGRLSSSGPALRMQLKLEHKERAQVTSHNVLAEVPGTDLAHEVVLIGAHLDTWDISPGALDDGAGVGIVTAAAKVLMDGGRRPRRTVRVALFANEENGFDGALAYGQRYQAVTHQLVGESDFGAGRVWRLRSRVRGEALPCIAAMAEVLKPLSIAAAGNDGTPAPDAIVLMRSRGWPGIELTQDGSRYFDVHHTVNDTLDKIDASALPQNVAAWAVVAWLAAQSELAFGPLEVRR